MSRRLLVIVVALIAGAAFVGGSVLYDRFGRPPERGQSASSTLVRAHSPVIGPAGAPVTIVEFFDPSCEACRAFHPIVKRIMATFPNEVRLVIRYTPFHEGSDVAVRILEAARAQGRFEPVLEALLEGQPQWAVHGAPDLEKAWSLAGAAGLDVPRARVAAVAPQVDRVLDVDVADVKANGVERTPTFFVNGRPLTTFGPQQLFMLVAQEVEEARKVR
ncbi:DsbA family protein [Alsobacter sp. R-9]